MTTAPLAAGVPTRLTTTVPREYVHKSALAEVLLTEWQRIAPDTFTVRAQWPRAHSFYITGEGLYDSMLLAETVRQSIPLLSHACYDVPFGHHQIWDYFRYSVYPEALCTGSTPAEIELHISLGGVKARRHLTAATMYVEATRDGLPLGTAETRFTNHAPALYRRLRGFHADIADALARTVPLPPPVPPGIVGRQRHHNVVLAPTNRARYWQLRVDTAHPVLFDHPVDHTPGMVLLEAARQAGHAATHPDDAPVTGMEAEFHRFAELDSPCWIEAAADPAPGRPQHGTRVLARQNGHDLFSATVTS